MNKSILVMLFGLAALSCSAKSPTTTDELQTLSGTIRQPGGKSVFPFVLDLDGATGAFNLSGEAVQSCEPGARILVKGVIRTRLVNPRSDGSPQQQPVHWQIFMDAQEVELIQTAFGRSG